MKIEIDAVLKELEYAKNMEFEHRHYTAIQNAMGLITKLESLAVIGKCTEQCFEDGAVFLIGDNDEVDNVFELIEWCEEHIK